MAYINFAGAPFATQTAKTANYTILSSERDIPVDSSAGVFTVTLPASPGDSQSHTITDVSGACGGYTVTVGGGGANIGGMSSFAMSEAGATLTVKYCAAFTRWLIVGYTTRAPALWYSAARHATRSAATSSAGNFTVGCRFYANIDVNCIGVRFYWIAAASKSVKVSLWDNTGTRLATATVTVPSTGIYAGFFASVALTAYALYRVTCWQTDGANYTNNSSTPYFNPPVLGGAAVFWDLTRLYLAGDAAPTTTAASEVYTSDPILVYP